MKITPEIIAALSREINADLAEIARTAPASLVKDLQEQAKSGGDRKITIKITVDVEESQDAFTATTAYSWERKVRTADSFVPHVVDGQTLLALHEED